MHSFFYYLSMYISAVVYMHTLFFTTALRRLHIFYFKNFLFPGLGGRTFDYFDITLFLFNVYKELHKPTRFTLYQ